MDEDVVPRVEGHVALEGRAEGVEGRRLVERGAEAPSPGTQEERLAAGRQLEDASVPSGPVGPRAGGEVRLHARLEIGREAHLEAGPESRPPENVPAHAAPGPGLILEEARLLGRLVDTRETLDSSTPTQATSASNMAEFERLFGLWAGIAVKGLDNLKAVSPVPEKLKPGQRLEAPAK